MVNENVIKNSRMMIFANMAAGVALLVAGLLLAKVDVGLAFNKKALVGISLIPFAIAFSKWLNLYFVTKYPKELSAAIISENDERLVIARNTAEANSGRILRWLLNLTFLGYTLMAPNDIFNAAGWWIILVLLSLSHLLPLYYLGRLNRQDQEE